LRGPSTCSVPDEHPIFTNIVTNSAIQPSAHPCFIRVHPWLNPPARPSQRHRPRLSGETASTSHLYHSAPPSPTLNHHRTVPPTTKPRKFTLSEVEWIR